MDFKSHFKKIHDFLTPYKSIWYMEVLNNYPQSLSAYPQQWFIELEKLTNKQLWQIDSRNYIDQLNNTEFSSFISEIKQLTQIERRKLDSPASINPSSFQKVKLKKRHEILKISEALCKLQSKNNFSHIVDIGGGVGHLSRIIAHHFAINSICLDMNKDFQEIGKSRIEKMRLQPDVKKVEFVNIKFGIDKKHEELLAPIFSTEAFTIGLHTCGPLAIKHMQTNIKYQTKGLLNFGCCYNIMHPQNDVNISSFSKSNQLPLSQHALTLATRGHSKISYDEYQIKEKIKSYRYALFLFHYHELNIKEFIAVGESSVNSYKMSFSDYAILKLSQVEISHNYSSESLNLFYEKEWVQKLVKKMFLADIIRWQFGRAIEQYILLDRAIYLEENNHTVEMKEFFDEEISPRNIGILALKK